MTTFLTALLVLAVDRIAKTLAVTNLHVRESLQIFPGIFHLTLVFNTGAAFGILKDQRLFFITVSLAAILLAVFYAAKKRLKDKTLALAFGLIIGGATGNLIDRIYLGYVIDFFDFRVWPVFNIADSSITIGVIILGFYLVKSDRHASNID